MECNANLKFLSFLQLQLTSDQKNSTEEGVHLTSLFVPLQSQAVPGEVPMMPCTCSNFDRGH